MGSGQRRKKVREIKSYRYFLCVTKYYKRGGEDMKAPRLFSNSLSLFSFFFSREIFAETKVVKKHRQGCAREIKKEDGITKQEEGMKRKEEGKVNSIIKRSRDKRGRKQEMLIAAAAKEKSEQPN